MNKLKRAINKLIINYAYGIKTSYVPEINLPLSSKIIKFARENRGRIGQILAFQPETIESYNNSGNLPIAQNTLIQRANRIFQAVQEGNANFLNLATPENIDNPNYNTEVITSAVANVFGDIDSEVLSSEEVLQYKNNQEILEFLKATGLEKNDYVQKGISVAINGGSLEVFKKLAKMLDISFILPSKEFPALEEKETNEHIYGMEYLQSIPDKNFSTSEYQKFWDMYGKYLPQMIGIGKFLNILVNLNFGNDDRKKQALNFINFVIQKTGVELITSPLNEEEEKKISKYFDGIKSTYFAMNHFLTTEEKDTLKQQQIKQGMDLRLGTLNGLSGKYKKFLSPEFIKKMEVYENCCNGIWPEGGIKTRILDLIKLKDMQFSISEEEVKAEWMKVKDALRKEYVKNLTSLKDMPRHINEYGIEEIVFNGQEFTFLHHIVTGECFESKHRITLSSHGMTEKIFETWSKNPERILNPDNFDISDESYNTVSTDLLTNNNIQASIHYETAPERKNSVHLIYTDIPAENIMGSNRQGYGREPIGVVASLIEDVLTPFADLRAQEENKEIINAWMGVGEVVLARNKIVKGKNGEESVDNSAKFLRPAAVVITGPKPTEREIRVAKALQIPFVRINLEKYPLRLQGEKEQTLRSEQKYDYSVVSKYLEELTRQERQTSLDPDKKEQGGR